MWTAGWGRCNGDAPVLRAVTGAIFSSRSRGLKVRSAEAFQARKNLSLDALAGWRGRAELRPR